MPTPETALLVDDIRLSDPELWLRDDIEGIFAKLRAERPVSWHEEFEFAGFPKGPGYWSLTRHEDVRAASRDPRSFISGKGSNIPDLPVEIAEFFGSMISLDAPRHTRLRLIVNKAFTPRMVARIEDDVRVKARTIVEAAAGKGECDFVTELAAPLPLHIICEMMGIPRTGWQRAFELTNVILGAGDPEYGGSMEALMGAAIELSQMAQEMGRARLADPTEDLTTALMHAEVENEDGVTQRLTTEELGSFFILLVVAGNETTRNAISHGMKALTDHPEQKARWMADFHGLRETAVEEIVRWATPVIHFRRTATADTVIGGREIAAGDKVVLWYSSANRDERVFEDPYRFDLGRAPNDHLGFGHTSAWAPTWPAARSP